jgi:Uma2 family endonuclease
MMRGDLVTNPGPQPRRLRFTVDQYYKMIELGMIDNYEKSEIIDGEMVQKITIGDRHAWVVDLLVRFFIKNLPDHILVRGQNPLRLGNFDEPEPDIVLADLTRYDGKRHPRAAETLLVVEVADASLRYDRTKKLPLYASSEITEVWIVNLPKNLIEVHSDPEIDIYQSTKICRLGDSVASSVLPDLKLTVDEILG